MKNRTFSSHYKKLAAAAMITAGLSALFSSVVFAGSWLKGDGENAGRWWYQNDDSSWLSDGWYLVEDAVYQSGWYRFDADGWQVEGPLETCIPEAAGAVVSEAAAFAEAELVPALNAVISEASASQETDVKENASPEASSETNASPESEVTSSVQEKSFNTTGSDLGPAIVEMMRSFEGRGIVPYVNGGRSLSGADCGSFIHLIFEMFDMDLPWIPTDMYNAGRKISQDELQPGDLIFFTKNGGASISHVAVYAGDVNGDRRIVHMTNSARNGVYYDRLADMYASGSQYYGAATFLH